MFSRGFSSYFRIASTGPAQNVTKEIREYEHQIKIVSCAFMSFSEATGTFWDPGGLFSHV